MRVHASQNNALFRPLRVSDLLPSASCGWKAEVSYEAFSFTAEWPGKEDPSFLAQSGFERGNLVALLM